MTIPGYPISVDATYVVLTFLGDFVLLTVTSFVVGLFVFFNVRSLIDRIAPSYLEPPNADLILFLFSMVATMTSFLLFSRYLETKKAAKILENTITQSLTVLDQSHRERFAKRIIDLNSSGLSLPALLKLERDVLTELHTSLLAKKSQGLPKQELLEEIRLSSPIPVQPAIKNLINDLYPTADSPSLFDFARRVLDKNTPSISRTLGSLNIDNGTKFLDSVVRIWIFPYVSMITGACGVGLFVLFCLQQRQHTRSRAAAPGHQITEKPRQREEQPRPTTATLLPAKTKECRMRARNPGPQQSIETNSDKHTPKPFSWV